MHAIRTQRNMRIHCLATIVVLALGYILQFSPVELAILTLTVSLVLVAELINTAIETTVDLITPEYHPLAKTAKNVAAGAVLVMALGAVMVGVFLFFNRLVPLR